MSKDNQILNEWLDEIKQEFFASDKSSKSWDLTVGLRLPKLINKRVREAEIRGVIAAENYHLELGDESIENARKRWSEILDRQNQLTSDREES